MSTRSRNPSFVLANGLNSWRNGSGRVNPQVPAHFLTTLCDIHVFHFLHSPWHLWLATQQCRLTIGRNVATLLSPLVAFWRWARRMNLSQNAPRVPFLCGPQDAGIGLSLCNRVQPQIVQARLTFRFDFLRLSQTPAIFLRQVHLHKCWKDYMACCCDTVFAAWFLGPSKSTRPKLPQLTQIPV